MCCKNNQLLIFLVLSAASTASKMWGSYRLYQRNTTVCPLFARIFWNQRAKRQMTWMFLCNTRSRWLKVSLLHRQKRSSQTHQIKTFVLWTMKCPQSCLDPLAYLHVRSHCLQVLHPLKLLVTVESTESQPCCLWMMMRNIWYLKALGWWLVMFHCLQVLHLLKRSMLAFILLNMRGLIWCLSASWLIFHCLQVLHHCLWMMKTLIQSVPAHSLMRFHCLQDLHHHLSVLIRLPPCERSDFKVYTGF